VREKGASTAQHRGRLEHVRIGLGVKTDKLLNYDLISSALLAAPFTSPFNREPEVMRSEYGWRLRGMKSRSLKRNSNASGFFDRDENSSDYAGELLPTEPCCRTDCRIFHYPELSALSRRYESVAV